MGSIVQNGVISKGIFAWGKIMLIFNFSVTDGCTPKEKCAIGNCGRICYICAPSLYFINSNRVSAIGLSVMLYYIHAYVHTYIQNTHIYIYIYTNTHTHKYIPTYIHTYKTHTYTHTLHIHTHIQTHAHTPWIENFVKVETERIEVIEMQTIQN